MKTFSSTLSHCILLTLALVCSQALWAIQSPTHAKDAHPAQQAISSPQPLPERARAIPEAEELPSFVSPLHAQSLPAEAQPAIPSSIEDATPRQEPLSLASAISATLGVVIMALSSIPIYGPVIWIALIVLGLAMPPLALALGLGGRAKIKRNPGRYKGGWLANYGIVLSALTMAVMILGMLLVLMLMFVLI